MSGTLQKIKAIDAANAKALALKAKLDAEAAAKAEQSKQRMGMADTLNITGKVNPQTTFMRIRAVFWKRSEEEK